MYLLEGGGNSPLIYISATCVTSNTYIDGNVGTKFVVDQTATLKVIALRYEPNRYRKIFVNGEQIAVETIGSGHTTAFPLVLHHLLADVVTTGSSNNATPVQSLQVSGVKNLTLLFPTCFNKRRGD